MNLEMIYDEKWFEKFVDRLKNDGLWVNWELYKFFVEIQKILVIFEFEGLWVFLYLFFFILFFYQFEVV